jgi:hypothetical protein
VWAKTGRVTRAPHIPHEELAVGKPKVQLRLETVVVEIPLRQSIADEDDAFTFLRWGNSL